MKTTKKIRDAVQSIRTVHLNSAVFDENDIAGLTPAQVKIAAKYFRSYHELWWNSWVKPQLNKISPEPVSRRRSFEVLREGAAISFEVLPLNLQLILIKQLECGAPDRYGFIAVVFRGAKYEMRESDAAQPLEATR